MDNNRDLQLDEIRQQKIKVIPDTNFFIDGLEYLQTLQPKDIIVSSIVVKELDGLKSSNENSTQEIKDRAYKVRKAIHFITDSNLHVENPPRIAKLEELQLEDSNDDKIIATGLHIQEKINELVIFLTFDRAASLIARGVNMTCPKLTHDDMKPKASFRFAKKESSTYQSTIFQKKEDETKTIPSYPKHYRKESSGKTGVGSKDRPKLKMNGNTGLAANDKTRRPPKLTKRKKKNVKLLFSRLVLLFVISFFIMAAVQCSEEENSKIDEQQQRLENLPIPFDNVEVSLTEYNSNEYGFQLFYEVINRNEFEIEFGYPLEKLNEEESSSPLSEFKKQRFLHSEVITLRYNNDTVEYTSGREILKPNQVERVYIGGRQPLETLTSIHTWVQDTDSGEVREMIFNVSE
ncbi:PIN domain-containing protein [Alkalihalobacterium bogoriense]|uniref:PIN domain-containing protein n=1 Tax=Alkalihalobacterium bogoriense TaxID=246272 RepID=UPI00047D9AD9|nr:PIN domain-containing protein [Alkalihalobacterium bogoriense]